MSLPARKLTPPSGDAPFFYGMHDAVFEVTLHEPGGATPRVPEALVQDLWQTQRFNAAALVTAAGEAVAILDPGVRNTDGGPDFTGARLRIDGVEWCGAVEVHTTSSGWFGHKHHLDPAYDSVVLHVTLHADVWTGGLLHADGSPVPEVVLYPGLDTPLRSLLYQFYTQPAPDVLCAASWSRVPAAVREPWLRALAAERMQAKKERLAAAYLHTPDLDALLYERLFAGMGYAKNDEAMTELARRVPLALARRVGSLLDREALYLGVAGLLPNPADLLQSDRASADYAVDLRDRFERLQLRFDLPVMERSAWRFFRLRPANFPPLRIAQAAALFRLGHLLDRHPLDTLVSAVRSDEPVKALRSVLFATPGVFWETHVRLEKSTVPRDPSIGCARLDALIANAVAPVLLLYAEQTNDPALEAAVLDVLRRLPARQDEVTRRFAALGTRPRDALAAQGIHQLYRTRCHEARCLSCNIGRFLLEGD